VNGVDVALAAVAGFTPDTVADRTGVPAETTRRIARELASAPTAAVYGRVGVHTVVAGTVASWATDVLNTITGNLDRPGGAMWGLGAHARPGPSTGGGAGYRIGRWTSRVSAHPEANGELPVGALAEEIETEGPGQIRALITIAGNPVLSTPHSDRLDRALGGLEFMVSIDAYVNETTRHADVILPPPSPLAKSHYDAGFYGFSLRRIANFSPPVFAAETPSESAGLPPTLMNARTWPSPGVSISSARHTPGSSANTSGRPRTRLCQRQRFTPLPLPALPWALRCPAAASGNIAPPSRSRLPVSAFTTRASQQARPPNSWVEAPTRT
jgi:hypothetical protein